MIAEMVALSAIADDSEIPAGRRRSAVDDVVADAVRLVVQRAVAADGTGDKSPLPSELPDRDWRADPSDGMRPLKHIRQTWRPETTKTEAA